MSIFGSIESLNGVVGNNRYSQESASKVWTIDNIHLRVNDCRDIHLRALRGVLTSYYCTYYSSSSHKQRSKIKSNAHRRHPIHMSIYVQHMINIYDIVRIVW